MDKKHLAPQRGFFPQPVYLIGTKKKDGKPDFALVTWLTFCSAEPPVVMFSLRGGKATKDAIENTGVLTASLVGEPLLRAADACGLSSGFKEDKASAFGIEVGWSDKIDAPFPSLSPWVYECRVVEKHPVADCVVYFAEVIGILADASFGSTEYGKLDLPRLCPAIYSPGSYYSLGVRLKPVGFSLEKREEPLPKK